MQRHRKQFFFGGCQFRHESNGYMNSHSPSKVGDIMGHKFRAGLKCSKVGINSVIVFQELQQL